MNYLEILSFQANKQLWWLRLSKAFMIVFQFISKKDRKYI